MMIGIVSRLTEQKGMELISRVLPELMASRVQLVVLGTGEAHYENVFRSAQNAYPGRLSANFTYSEELSHQIYAACDAFLMPSTFEGGGKELVHNLTGHIVVDESSRHHEHVGIVVLTNQMGYLRNPAQSCAHLLVLVQRDADTLA